MLPSISSHVYSFERSPFIHQLDQLSAVTNQITFATPIGLRLCPPSSSASRASYCSFSWRSISRIIRSSSLKLFSSSLLGNHAVPAFKPHKTLRWMLRVILFCFSSATSSPTKFVTNNRSFALLMISNHFLFGYLPINILSFYRTGSSSF